MRGPTLSRYTRYRVHGLSAIQQGFYGLLYRDRFTHPAGTPEDVQVPLLQLVQSS